MKPAEKKKPNSSRPVTPPRNMVTKQAKKWGSVWPVWTRVIQSSCVTDQECCAHRTVHCVFSFILSCIFLLYRPQRPLWYQRAAFLFDLSVCSWRQTWLFIPTSGWCISVSHKLRPLVYKCREELDVWDCKSTLHEVWDDSCSPIARSNHCEQMRCFHSHRCFYAPKASLHFVILSCECAMRFDIQSNF